MERGCTGFVRQGGSLAATGRWRVPQSFLITKPKFSATPKSMTLSKAVQGLLGEDGAWFVHDYVIFCDMANPWLSRTW